MLFTQGVLEVSLQFQKITTKAIDAISSSDFFYVLGGYQSLYHMALVRFLQGAFSYCECLP
jgi:hypothetical protein